MKIRLSSNNTLVIASIVLVFIKVFNPCLGELRLILFDSIHGFFQIGRLYFSHEHALADVHQTFLIHEVNAGIIFYTYKSYIPILH